jgi:phosphatidylglycerophosphate synthase
MSVIPNALSIGRMVLGISFPWIPASWRIAVIIAAALSDLADGASSRQFQVTSSTGRILDPVADKVFVLMVVLTLVVEKLLGIWDVVLVGSRDIVVLAGVGWCVVSGYWSALVQMKPTLWGKLATVAQFLFLLVLLIRDQRDLIPLVVTAAISGWAAIHYLWTIWKRRPGRRGSMRVGV